MTDKPKTIFIAGYYGYGNAGDEAILSVIIKDLRAEIPNSRFIVVSGNPQDTKISHGVEAISGKDLQQIIAKMTLCDLVILGGGGLFHDYWGFDPDTVLTSNHKGIAFYSSIVLLAFILGKPLMLYAIGVGPLQSEMGKYYTRAITDLAHTVSVRDEDSRKILRTLGVKSNHIHITADPAFRLHLRENRTIIRDQVSQPGPILGIALRNWDVGVLPDTWERDVAEAIDSFLDSYSGSAVFIPFQEKIETDLDDLSVSERVKRRMRNPDQTLILKGDYSPTEKAGVITECDLLLGMRMHSIIFAIHTETPVVGICYDPKVQHVMKQAGIDKYAIDLRELNGHSLASLLESAFCNRDQITNQMHAVGTILYEKAEKNTELAIAAMDQASNYRQSLTPEGIQLLKQAMLSLCNALTESSEQTQEIGAKLQTITTLKIKLEEQVGKQAQIIEDLNSELEIQRSEHIKELQKLRRYISQSNREIENCHLLLSEKEITINSLDSQLQDIKGSRGWKLLWFMWEIRLFFIPKGSGREKVLKKIWNGLARNPLRSIKRAIDHLFRKFSVKMSRYAFAFDSFKRSRISIYPPDLSSLRLPSSSDLVSIVLPVYNGADLVGEALKSVMDQTYENFELIVINDGSYDDSGKIIDEYAIKDKRIRVIHQENKKLPRALSRGFQEARGEYLTWISHDNRLKPDFLDKMVACLRRHPNWDMIYANQDLIGEKGAPLRGSDWYDGYQRPRGSEHVHLPKDTAELNTRPNNFIGGGFLYRDRVGWLIGDYSPLRYTREDYDYWMRVNSLMTLRHADFQESVYEYRFHADSLTNRDQELGITRDRRNLMVFDDFRRDFYLTPLTWFIEEDISVDHSAKGISILNDCIKNAGHTTAQVSQFEDFNLPYLWVPYVYLQLTTNPDVTPPVPKNLPPNTTTVLLCLSPKNNLPSVINEGWDFCLAHSSEISPVSLNTYKQGWLVSNTIKALFTAIDIRVRSRHLEQIEHEISLNKAPEYKISVIICTYNRQENIEDTLRSTAEQTMLDADYEIIVVNNDPVNNNVAPIIEKIKTEYFSGNPAQLRLIDCPILGLSHARNAGLSESKGEILYFIDDDATAEKDTLDLYWKAFSEHPEVGVIGGHILLGPQDPIPVIWRQGWEKYWSQFVTGYESYTVVDNWGEYPWGANWCARREALLWAGGFRGGYGRRGSDYSGGEEIVAACLINQLGYKIAVLPQAQVTHNIEAYRFTLGHLKHTIIAGLFTQYQAQAELRIPIEISIWNTVKQINESQSTLISNVQPKNVGKKARWVETYYFIYARWRLFLRQTADFAKRFRQPSTRI
ncbi:MAG: glycosyltransferase [Chloroflexi bacterium]|nr:glycosyltransferase [Chloroflexota bacterium]